MINRIKSILKWLTSYEKSKFNTVCRQHNLNLNYNANQSSVAVFYSVFSQREYADYFPFYEKAIVIDVGAHYGYFSIFASRNLAPESTIYSFEPHPKNVAVCKRNLKDNNIKNCIVHQKAVAAKTGHVKLYESNAINHSLYSETGTNFMEVEATTLKDILADNSIETVDFLKLDCEGEEYEILLQASSDTLSKIQTISLEFHHMRKQNYRPQQLAEKLSKEHFEIKKYSFSDTFSGTNYGHMIASKMFTT